MNWNSKLNNDAIQSENILSLLHKISNICLIFLRPFKPLAVATFEFAPSKSVGECLCYFYESTSCGITHTPSCCAMLVSV